MTGILLDTDVNLNFISARQPSFADAKRISEAVARNEVTAYIASISAININYIGRKEKGRDAILAELEKLIKIVEVFSINSNYLRSAPTSPITDYEDAVQHECAVSENLDAIVTRWREGL